MALLAGGLKWRSTHVANAAPVEAKVASSVEIEDVQLRALGGKARAEAKELPDLSRISVDDGTAVAPSIPSGRAIKLTVRPELQRFANKLLASHHLPEAAVVMTDVKTGHVIAYASHVENGRARDLCREATAPSASVFKIITASALLEKGVADINTLECYPDGGESRITPFHLRVDPARDHYCSTLAQAMGKSTNPVFARLASRHLQPSELEQKARTLGYGTPLPFDVPLTSSDITIPTDALGFARTAAGFWNSTLSPVHAAWLATTIARGGNAIDLHVVDGEPAEEHVVMAKDQADHVQDMLEHTVVEGTSRRAFHDGHGTPFLPGIRAVGKTGTLSDNEKNRFYTWFMGSATPEDAEKSPVAIAVLVVNRPTWKVKANVIAREMLRAYFAGEKLPHVTMPKIDRNASSAGSVAALKKPRAH